jgi:hypothetical protein
MLARARQDRIVERPHCAHCRRSDVRHRFSKPVVRGAPTNGWTGRIPDIPAKRQNLDAMSPKLERHLVLPPRSPPEKVS